MKQAAVIIAESGKVKDITIEPGTEAQDVLTAIGLPEGYVLTGARGQEPFGADEDIYDKIVDGSKLYASTPVEVGMA